MFIKYLDYLSPRVTFYHKGFLSHNSVISGILSVIAICFIIILAVYFSLEIIQRKNPNSFYFHSFIEDAGTFRVDRSSLFHFLTIGKNYQGIFTNEGFDFTTFNIIGVNAYYQNYLIYQRMEGYNFTNHWLYGPCDRKINTNGLDDILVYDFFEKSACIKKYYNLRENAYYDVGDPKFKWPEIAHGTFNDNNKLYNLIIQKCDNRILNTILGEGNHCKNEAEFNEYFKAKGTRLFHFYFVNNYINLLNYDEPNFKFFYRLESPLSKDQFTINDINFDPALIRTNNGLVIDNIIEEVSYIFDRNDVYVENSEGKNVYMVYAFFLKNIMDYYERTYKRVQDILSSIGGINQAVTIIAIYLNNFYNSFVVLYDTELLLHSTIHSEKKIHKKQSTHYLNLKKLKELENVNKNNENKKTSERIKINSPRDKVKEKNFKTENEISINNNISKTNNILNNKDDVNELNKDKPILNKINETDVKIGTSSTLNYIKALKRQKTFLYYICFKITCGRKKRLFKLYENFRIKIISEEHLIRNHLNIYNLLKVTERKRHARKNSYQLKDLINLV